MKYPKMHRIRQVIEAPEVENLEETISQELESLLLESKIKPGARIAVTAGSRGINHIDRILKRIIDFLKQHEAKPFLVPAMGSHGDGSAEGQLDVLKSLNITEETMGVPIHSSMEVVEIGKSSFDFPVLVDKLAAESDGIVVVNRIKPHTEFEGPIESGLMKMMAIGLGKHKGCVEVHKQAGNYGYLKVIPEIGQIILDKLPILFGVGIVENIYDETAKIKAVSPDRFFEEEAELLIEAKRLMAKIPFDHLDVLIIDEIGKNISGTGLDTNVIGRIMVYGEKEPELPQINRIVVLDMTEESHGNAVGIGLSDYISDRLYTKINRSAVAKNAIAANTPEKGRIPISLPTDRETVEAALNTIGAIKSEDARIVHIKNTLELKEMHISNALLPETTAKTNLVIMEEIGPISFDNLENIERVVVN
ncbi:MAG: DUF2088 domain-containing protein [Deltaproteobacteria bacterium]|nr:DUF2088 domain-containing protein [Deltaproteobacteria bacterium]